MPFLTSGGKSLPRGGLLPPDVRYGIVQAWYTVGERSHAKLPPLTSVFSTKPPSRAMAEAGMYDAVSPIWWHLTNREVRQEGIATTDARATPLVR